MAKGRKVVPVGLKKVEKGHHSERVSFKAGWFQEMILTSRGWEGGRKFMGPYSPPCIPAGNSWPK